MNAITNKTQIMRSPGDPKVLRSGHSSLTAADSLARGLGWFSLGLGIVELVAPGRITKALGLEGKEGLIRAYGAREIAAGIPTLSFDRNVGLASRIVGDFLDLATLAPALSRNNPKRDNAAIAFAAVAAVTVLDVVALAATSSAHSPSRGRKLDYSNRSGLPKGLQASRGLARRSFEQPGDMRAEPQNRPPQRVPTGRSPAGNRVTEAQGS